MPSRIASRIVSAWRAVVELDMGGLPLALEIRSRQRRPRVDLLGGAAQLLGDVLAHARELLRGDALPLQPRLRAPDRVARHPRLVLLGGAVGGGVGGEVSGVAVGERRAE